MNHQNTGLSASFESRKGKTLRWSVSGFAAIATLMFGILAFFVVPAPDNRTATEVTGILASMSRPHPEYGDISIVLDNGERYYINRANEIAYLDWEAMLAEVQPGDEVTLIAVKPLVWRILPDEARSIQPIAGLRTQDKVYMNAEIAATTWDSQGRFNVIAIFSFIAFIVCLLPDLFRLFNRHALTRA
jgi:hypothetical protein